MKRRNFLKTLGVTSAAAVVGVPSLAACQSKPKLKFALSSDVHADVLSDTPMRYKSF